MSQPIYFDSASTTPCCSKAVELFRLYSEENFGNPSSSHSFGQKAASELHQTRIFFSEIFQVNPEQVIFTGSGTEANNLAIYGTLMARWKPSTPLRVLASSTEHASVSATVSSLESLGVETQFLPVDSQGQLQTTPFLEALSPHTSLLSIHHVNNLFGTCLPVEAITQEAKSHCPQLIVHTDASQSFGKLPVPNALSKIDMITLSAHKIGGPKGIGALILLNKKLLKSGFRPYLFGGGQENGWRSGTQNVGLIAGFRVAAELALQNQSDHFEHVTRLNHHFKKLLPTQVRWNSPVGGSPYIVHLSVPGYPAGPLVKLLEERNCLVSTGAACQTRKTKPDPALRAMGLLDEMQKSSLRVSFSASIQLSDIETLAAALQNSLHQMEKLL